MCFFNQQTKGNNSARQTRDTSTKTWIAYGNSTWRASTYKVYKLYQRYILKKNAPSGIYTLHFRHTRRHMCVQAFHMRWQNFGETTTEEGHKVFFSGKRINTSLALDLLFTRTSWTLLWDVAQSSTGSSSSACGQSLSTLQQYKHTPQHQTTMTTK